MNSILAGCIAFTVSFGLPILVGASRKSYGQEWYRRLKKPSHSASDVTVNVVFIVIYLSEVFALYQFLKIPALPEMALYTSWFVATAMLSGIWSRLFFQLKRCDIALATLGIEVVMLWALVYTLHANGIAGWMFLLPRALWVPYAFTVNLQLYKLNIDFWKSRK
jgi:tryptophan-rich sensory protein